MSFMGEVRCARILGTGRCTASVEASSTLRRKRVGLDVCPSTLAARDTGKDEARRRRRAGHRVRGAGGARRSVADFTPKAAARAVRTGPCCPVETRAPPGRAKRRFLQSTSAFAAPPPAASLLHRPSMKLSAL
ncbi:MAG: hypothetical protein ABW220_19595, partial [Burkholderiaceae bacterium]